MQADRIDRQLGDWKWTPGSARLEPATGTVGAKRPLPALWRKRTDHLSSTRGGRGDADRCAPIVCQWARVCAGGQWTGVGVESPRRLGHSWMARTLHYRERQRRMRRETVAVPRYM
jgi:hypothetical protein